MPINSRLQSQRSLIKEKRSLDTKFHNTRVFVTGGWGEPTSPAKNLLILPPPSPTPPPPKKKLFPPTKSQLPTQNSMLILILINVHYSQKAAFSFAKGLNCQYHSSLGSLHPVKKSPPVKFPIPPTHPTPDCYLENPENGCKRKETVNIDILLTSKKRKINIKESIIITSGPPSRIRNWNQFSQFRLSSTKVIHIVKALACNILMIKQEFTRSMKCRTNSSTCLFL